MSGENNSQDLLVKVQKKVLGKMVGKNSIKLVVDDNISVVLDDFYKWAKVIKDFLPWFQSSEFQIESGKPTAEKLLKDAIKLVVKTGVLFHNKQIQQSEMKSWEILRSKINNIANTICYFHRTPFTYNKDMLHGQLDSADTLLKNALKVVFPQLIDVTPNISPTWQTRQSAELKTSSAGWKRQNTWTHCTQRSTMRCGRKWSQSWKSCLKKTASSMPSQFTPEKLRNAYQLKTFKNSSTTFLLFPSFFLFPFTSL